MPDVRLPVVSTLAYLIMAPSVLQAADSPEANPNLLWYTAPADAWIKALPIGNGRLGAMVFGQPAQDRLQLNDVTVWSGSPQPDADRADAYKNLPELRRLIRSGAYDQAAKFAEQHFNGPASYSSSYQTLGDLTFAHVLPPGAVQNYQRRLDLTQALGSVDFTVGGIGFHREVFASAPDQVLAQRLTASAPAALSFTMGLGRVRNATTRFVAPDTLVMTGTSGGALHYEVRARALATGGTVSGAGGTLTITKADTVTILLTAATTFTLDYAKGYTGGDLTLAEQHLQAATQHGYEALKAAHVAEYSRYFSRVDIDLGQSEPHPTDERLRNYRDGLADPGFAALFYQYGRYLLISSSRPDNPLPSNSQGLWGDGLDLPWKCDYKANINYEMNYWAAEPSNLGEMHLPMLRMTQNLVQPGTKTAQAYFGPTTPGWLCGYTTNGWSWTSPGKSLPWGIWFGGSAWMCQHLWEHYAFTRDRAYLAEVYPTMKGAAAFWLANLIEGSDGRLITSPSTSPENSFKTDNGIKSTICEGATMEKSIVWDLLTNTALAARVLGTDAEFRQQVEAARDRIRPPQVGRHGQIMEWGGDWDDPKDTHRHVSHLFALFPGHEITVLGTPTLADAAKVTLTQRGDDGTGWSIAWKENFWARLRDGDHAHRLMAYQFRYTEELKTVMSGAGGTYPNLFDAHPPFQIDANFGAVSGINEMLLQSQLRYVDPQTPNEDRYLIDLLPALPSAWPTGSIHGLRARGGFAVSLDWKNGTLVKAVITSVGGTNPKVRHGSREAVLRLAAGATITVDGMLK